VFHHSREESRIIRLSRTKGAHLDIEYSMAKWGGVDEKDGGTFTSGTKRGGYTGGEEEKVGSVKCQKGSRDSHTMRRTVYEAPGRLMENLKETTLFSPTKDMENI